MALYLVEVSDRKKMRHVFASRHSQAVKLAVGPRLRKARLDAKYDGGALTIYECAVYESIGRGLGGEVTIRVRVRRGDVRRAWKQYQADCERLIEGVTDPMLAVAESRVRHELMEKLFNVVGSA